MTNEVIATDPVKDYKLPIQRIGLISIDVTKFVDAAANLQGQADRAEVKTSEDYAKGGDLIKIARTEAAKAEDLRKELVGPFNKIVKFVNESFNKGAKVDFGKVRTTIEAKMLVWKRVEDEKLRKKAVEEAKRLEEEALARAAIEKSEEGQDEVLEVAAEAAEKVVETAGVGLQRGNYGSSTGSRKTYSTNVINMIEFLESAILLAKNGEVEIASIIEFRKSGMNKLSEYMLTKRTNGKGKTNNVPGAEFLEADKIRVY